MDASIGVQILDILGATWLPKMYLGHARLAWLLVAFKSLQNKIKQCARNQIIGKRTEGRVRKQIKIHSKFREKKEKEDRESKSRNFTDFSVKVKFKSPSIWQLSLSVFVVLQY